MTASRHAALKMSSTWLPPELIDMVMDHLHSDESTLAACSAVCKAWIHPARSRLFAKISLNQTGVRKLLMSGSALIPFIRHLRIECYEPSFWTKNMPPLVGFKSIKSLSLEYTPWHGTFLDARLSLQTHFATIVCLRLYEIYNDSFSELAEVVCSFPHLETLVMNRVVWVDSDTPSSSLCLSDNLRALEVRGCRALEVRGCKGSPILEWLLSLERTPALHTIYLHESDLDGINRFLRAMGNSLEVLLCGTRIYDVDCPVNLNYNIRLQVLHIKLYKANYTARQRVTQCVTRILSQIVSEHMTRVVFEVVVDEEDSHELLEWTEVDSILVLSQFSRLKNVDIKILELWDGRLWEKLDFPDWFISRLPRCHARGILSIHLADLRSIYL